MKITTENTEDTEMKWRNASVTLPDDGETVIIHTLGGDVWTGFLDGDVAWNDGTAVWRNVLGARIHDEERVLHWMPLPNPPKEAK
jgi:hypothetical protein